MQFSELALYLEKLEKTSSRLEITRILSELFEATTSAEVDKIGYLSLGILAPNYEGVLLNLAEKMMIRTLALAFNKSADEVKSLYKKSGDLGDTAEELSQSTVHPSQFTVTDVYENFWILPRTTERDRRSGKLK